ncbi:2TM domain-containing protein [Variovorax sp. OV329]|uniref:2TM domain-containing protein n=1 Tax=Variovorax sp. OV329 TaxID=1882825 RepID=UPI0008EA2160|nr:2TM domain-containing protein [Variovorax sp. OV329]SFN49328.1 2TM domain-containing protein [Variovorax sp. OV329]
MTQQQQHTLERLAVRRARAKAGWWMHATVFAIVNLGMAALSLSSGRHWALYPFFGWGVALALHAAAVWLLAPGGEFMERLVARERSKLQARDPW